MDPRNLAWQGLSDPNTSASRLQEIAVQFPEFHEAITKHPNVYPELVQWITAQSAPSAPAGDAGYGVVVNQIPETYGVVTPENLTPSADPAFGAPAGTESNGQIPGGYAPVTDAYVEENKPKSRLPKILTVSAVSVLLVALVGGLIFWFAIGRKITGSASPEAAVEKLIDSVISLDQYSLYGSIAPSEMAPLLEVVSAAEDKFEGTGYADTWEYAERIHSALDITVSNLETQTVELAEGITRIDIVGGAIEIRGDETELRGILTEIVEGTFDSLEGAEFTDDMRNEMELGMDEFFNEQWPVTADLNDLFVQLTPEEREWFPGIPMVTVQEGGSWYVSPLLTLGEFARIGMEASGNVSAGGYQYGSVPDAAEAATPEEAVATLTAGIENLVHTGDAEDLAAALSLPERRLLGLHSGLFEQFTGADAILEIEPDVTVVSNNGSVAIVQPKDLVISVTDSWSDTVTVEFNEWCVRGEDGYSGRSEWICLDEALEQGSGMDFDFDLSKLGLATVKEDGNWHVSLAHTYSHLVTAVLDVIDEEFLNQLALSPTF